MTAISADLNGQTDAVTDIESIKGYEMSFRKALLCVFVFSVACTGAALFAQYVLGFNPCVLCIEQRMAVMATGIAALLCALFPSRSFWAKTFQAALTAVPALTGLYLSVYQLRLQSLPEADQPSCGAPWTFRLREAPLLDWYEPLIRGTGNCGVIEKFLGVPFALWAALFFAVVLLGLAAVWWKNQFVR